MEERMKVNVEKRVDFCTRCGDVAIDAAPRCSHYEHHENVYIKDVDVDVYKCKQCGTLSSHYRKIRLPLPWWVKYDIFNVLGIPKFIEQDTPFSDWITGMDFASFSGGLVLRCPRCKKELY